MKKIGLYGGAFNPIHLGHLVIAEQAQNLVNLDQVIFIPSGIPPHKQLKDVNPKHRLNMVNLAVEENLKFTVDTRELKSCHINYTIDTVRSFTEMHPENEYYFIIGQDSLAQLYTWYQWELLIKSINFIVLGRPSVEENLQYLVKKYQMMGAKIWYNTDFLLDISSTKIRQYLALKKSVQYLLPFKVLEYIKREGLYGYKN